KIEPEREIKARLYVDGLIKISGLKACVYTQQLTVEVVEPQTKIDVADVSRGDDAAKVDLEVLLRPAGQLELISIVQGIKKDVRIYVAKVILRQQLEVATLCGGIVEGMRIFFAVAKNTADILFLLGVEPFELYTVKDHRRAAQVEGVAPGSDFVAGHARRDFLFNFIELPQGLHVAT